MLYDFIEIGTSDFDTLIQSCGDEILGLSVEPIHYYLDRLPDRKNVTKVCLAVGDKQGEVNIYYVSAQKIILYNLPNWVKGSNSIGIYHPAVLDLVTRLGLDPQDIFSTETIDVVTIEHLFNLYNVTGVKYLKIDAEGYDVRILMSFFKFLNKNKGFLLPNRIVFEHNSKLTSRIQTVKVIFLLITKGYDLVNFSKMNVVLNRTNSPLKDFIFSGHKILLSKMFEYFKNIVNRPVF